MCNTNTQHRTRGVPNHKARFSWLLMFLTACSVFLLSTTKTSAQTTLNAGDVAVVSINSANPDRFSVVFLKDVTAGTTFNVTDNGFTAASTTRTGEGFLTYTAPSALTAGTVVTWQNGMTITGTGWSSNAPTNFAFNGSGDQLFLFTGSTGNWPTLSGITLLFGMNYGTALSATSSAANTVQPSTSILPATSWLNLGSSTFANTYFANQSTSTSSVSITNTAANILALIVDNTKWFGNSSSAATFPSYSFTIGSAATMNSTGSFTAMSTTYGSASSASSTTVAVTGSGLTANVVATAPANFEVSRDGSIFQDTVHFFNSGGSASGTLSVRLKGNATVAASPYSGNVVLSTTGATNVTVAIPSSTVSALGVSITGATAQNKIYDGTNTATITGGSISTVNSDVITVTGGGTFAQSTVGTAINVTASFSLSGTNATSYSITAQPSGLTADITAKELTISGLTADNKVFDGNTTATLSGTPSLVGVLPADVANVTLGGTPVATFSSSAVGAGIAVTVTGYTLSGSAASNYSLTQPTGLTADITAANPPAITVSGTLSAVNTTYGTPSSSPTSFTVAGADLIGDITVTAPSGFEVSTSIGSGFATSLNLSPTSGTVSNTTIYVRLAATATVPSSPYSGMIACTSPSATTQNVATASSTVTPAEITITGATAQNKVYDGNNTATITGATLNGDVNGDALTLSAAGATFAQATVGTGISVTTNYSVTGTNASSYTVTQPSGLSADITVKELTITGISITNKVFDGNTTATISGTASLVGVIAADVANVTLGGTPVATFASSAIGTGIAVTVSGYSISGSASGNYTLTQPSGLTANITAPIIAQWTFEGGGSTSSPITAIGSGTASIVGSMGTLSFATGINTSTGCGTQVIGQNAWAFSAVNPGASNESSGAQFVASTAGYQNISFSWEQRWSNTSTNTVRLQYTLNGTTWTNFEMDGTNTSFCLGSINNGRFETNTTGDNYRRITVDLSSITGANNNANFGVRVVAAHYQATGQFRQVATPSSVATGGTWRFDNVTLRGELSPGPTASVISNGTGSSTICSGASANVKVDITGGTSPYTVVISDGTTSSTFTGYTSGGNISVSPTSNSTYTIVSVTDAGSNVGTGNSGSAAITVLTAPTLPVVVGTYSTTLNHSDGATLSYNDNCYTLASIQDSQNGNILGNTTVQCDVLASLPQNTNNNRYFLPLYYTITPTSNGVSTVSFYLTQADLDLYNANNGTQADLPSNSSDLSKAVHMRVMQVTGNGNLTTGTLVPDYATMTWDGANTRWVVEAPTTITNSSTFQTSGKYYFFTNESCTGVSITGLTATPSSTSCLLSWDAVNTLQGWYGIRYKAQGSPTWIYQTSSPASKTIVGLSSGVTYDVEVYRKCSNVDSGAVTSTSFTTPSCASGTPVINTPISTTFYTSTFTWNSVLVSGGWYDVRHRVSGSQTWINGSAGSSTSKTLVGLTPGETYEVEVRASCTGGAPSSWSQTATFTTQSCVSGAPVINTPITTTFTTATLSWNTVLVSGGWHDIRYRVQGSPTWINSSTGSSTSVTLAGLVSSTTYEIEVRGGCTGGTPGAWSQTATFTTKGCTSGTLVINTPITTTFTTATLSWNTVLVAGGWHDIRYRVQGSPTWINSSTGSSTSVTLAGLVSSTTYEIEVRGGCTGGTPGAWSQTATFTTKGCTSGTLVINTPITTTFTTATLSWNTVLVSGGWHDIRYRVQGSPTWINSSTGSSTSVTLAGLVSSTTYEIEVRGGCNGSTAGAWSQTATFTTQGCASGAPVINTPVVTTSTTATISWNSVLLSGGWHDIQYRVQGSPTWINSSSGPTNSVTVAGLQPGTTYELRLRAACNGGQPGAWSSEITFTTNGAMQPILFAEESTKAGFVVYPNPTRDQITIEFSTETLQATKVKVLDMTGRVVKTVEAVPQAGEHQYTLSLSELSAGMYTVQVYTDDKLSYVTKVQKQD